MTETIFSPEFLHSIKSYQSKENKSENSEFLKWLKNEIDCSEIKRIWTFLSAFSRTISNEWIDNNTNSVELILLIDKFLNLFKLQQETLISLFYSPSMQTLLTDLILTINKLNPELTLKAFDILIKPLEDDLLNFDEKKF